MENLYDVIVVGGGPAGLTAALYLARVETSLLLKLYLDNRPVSAELEYFITALAELSDKLTVSVAERNALQRALPVSQCAEPTEQKRVWLSTAFQWS